ncbi:MAG TPA: 30S ribosomal protein S13 [Candidatus Woesearchaeota archaeon]|nr:30S ribosomal protein S13 [Candidatus Woesearchaeota archaeon]
MSKSKVTTPKEEKKPKKAVEFKKIIRVAEADLDGSKNLTHALTSIKGIGWSYANAVRKALQLENKKVADLSDEEIAKIKDCLQNPENFKIPEWVFNRRTDLVTGKNFHLLSSSLILSKSMDVKRLKQIKCYKGIRHMFNYKVRGQRTRSRGANVKGRTGSTVGVVRKKQAPAKKKAK